MNAGDLAALITAGAAILTAVGAFLRVVSSVEPKLGVHDDRITKVEAAVEQAAAVSTAAATEVATVAPAVQAVVDAGKK